MAKPVTGVVNYKVNVRTEKRDGHWAAITRETGVFAYGRTEDEAVKRNAEANVQLVKSYKEFGEAAVADYMARMGLEYSIDSQPVVSPVSRRSNDRELDIAA
jgi:predicted RNase H-like HicB family nuclease